MTKKVKEYLSDETINELDSAFFDAYHENVCEVAIDNFRRDNHVATILVGHTRGAASYTKLFDKELKDEAVNLMKVLQRKNISTYSFVSEGKVRKQNQKKKVECIIISSHNKAGDARTTIYEIVNRDKCKVSLYATGEVQDNLWNYLLQDDERILH
jgi:hypothetical protein|tara:strand:- start:95 stop:562 length:468 start_codon:yes stop_codon:yes gene_type:complete